MIASAGVSLLVQAVLPGGLEQNVDWVATILFVAAFAVMRWKKPNPIVVMEAAEPQGWCATLCGCLPAERGDWFVNRRGAV